MNVNVAFDRTTSYQGPVVYFVHVLIIVNRTVGGLVGDFLLMDADLIKLRNVKVIEIANRLDNTMVDNRINNTKTSKHPVEH